MENLNDLYKEFFSAVINSGKEPSVDALDIAKQIIATDKNADYNIIAPNIDALAKELTDKENKISTSRLQNILFEYKGCIEDKKFISLMKPLCKGRYFSFSKYETSAKYVKFWIAVRGYLNKGNWIDLIRSGSCSEKQCKKLLDSYQNSCKKIAERNLLAICRVLKNRRSY